MTATRKDLDAIRAIADRAVALYERLGMMDDKEARFARSAIAVEILTVHEEVVPLRLDEFLAADDSNFAHDVGGIHRHLDHGTQTTKPRMKDCFLPRFAKV